MRLKNINKKMFFTTLSLVFTSITCTSCTVSNEENDDLISYDELVDNYKIVEFTTFNNKNLQIVKKEPIKDKKNCYGYFDIIYNDCIVKVDEENGLIIGKGVINNIVEMDIEKYLEMYSIKQDKFSNDDLGTIIEIIRNDYFEEEKVLVK